MLRSTFQHLPGIGRVREAELWRKGILSWDELEASVAAQLSLFGHPQERVYLGLSESRSALESRNASYFAERLPSAEYYRLAMAFPSEVLFLDIETTGLSRYYDCITLIGCEIAGRYRAFVRDSDEVDGLADVFATARVLVTFNGSLFDVPFVRQFRPDLPLPPCHIDLRFVGRRVGLVGGQKDVEVQLGIRRPRDLQSVSSAFAPVLWHRYRRGDIEALRLLVRYNHADIEGMKGILHEVIRREVRRLPVALRVQAKRLVAGRRSLLRFTTDASQEGTVRLFPYRLDAGPRLRISELRGVDSLRVVGIDLTGSEDRPSGLCLLRGNAAETLRLRETGQILAETLRAHPHVVSIDSPLSLPVGRVRVDDGDPEREVHGITRHCERTLKRRGINVYPCLIKSMQALTARGIALADLLRKQGIPVIESYPGAAQDILGIPRKRADLDLLVQGLRDFGIRGPYSERPESVTHDELDAITSAVVGLFFWSGRFEALGTEEEDYLVIPELEHGSRWTERVVIGLSGPLAAGKTTAGRFIESLGFAYGRYSQVLEDRLRQSGKEVTREELQRVGQEVYSSGRQRWLNIRLTERYPENRNLVIDGLRHAEDHAFLSERFGPQFVHVTVEAPRAMRLERYTQLGFSKEDFERADLHQAEAHVAAVARLAHAAVHNDGTAQAFARALQLALNVPVRGDGGLHSH